MFPFDPITAGSALILASAAPQICQMPKPAEISVVPKSAPVVIETNKTLADISNTQVDTINPYGYNNATHTNGYMDGRIEMRSSVKLDYMQAPQRNAFCIWYDSITVEIDITPKIVIAKEVAADECMYKAVLTHEERHVDVDRKIVNKLAQTIGQKVFNGLEQRGFIAGPIPPENTQEISERMKKTVSQLVEFEYRKMEVERAEAQQAVDNIHEYRFVQSKCPDFKPQVQK